MGKDNEKSKNNLKDMGCEKADKIYLRVTRYRFSKISIEKYKAQVDNLLE